MKDYPGVLVMLATYNGELYLGQQLESLRAQRGVSIDILARDDNSTDGTVALLQREGERRLWSVTMLRGTAKQPLGASASFFELIQAADLDHMYYAFCDQDDVWGPELLAEAVEALSKMPPGVPALHTCRRTLTDSELRPIGETQRATRPGLGSALVENIVSGAGTVINRELLLLMRENPPNGVIMYDWWAYLIASALGRVLLSQRPRLYYRQHGRNALGMKLGVGLWLYRVRTIPRRLTGHVRSRQAAAFLEVYGARLADTHRILVESVAKQDKTLQERLALARSPELWRQTTLETLLMRVMVLMGGL